MIRYIAIAGTHSSRREKDWDHHNSDFNKFLAERDIKPLVISPLKKYAWSTDLDGIDCSNDTWDAAGRALAHYVAPPLIDRPIVRPEDTYLISHSHGGNVIAYACGKYGLKAAGVITVGMPIRKDMMEYYEAASENIDRHLHLYAGWKDFMQILGAIRDGRWGIHRKHPFAKNAKMPGGHGSVLRDKKHFEKWNTEGWLDYWMGLTV